MKNYLNTTLNVRFASKSQSPPPRCALRTRPGAGQALSTCLRHIPFPRDKGAQPDLGAITTAEGVYKAQTTEGKRYAAVIVAASKSGSDKWFQVASKNTNPVEIGTGVLLTLPRPRPS